MERDLCKFYENITYINKDISEYSDAKGNRFIFNTINAIVRVDYLELTKEEYQSALFQQKIQENEYNIINIKKPVPKNEITKKDEDKFTIVEKEVAVRQIWNVSNPYGAFKSFNDKNDALKFANKINDNIKSYLD